MATAKTAVAADSLAYLRSVLDATPAGGWAQVNLNSFSDAWPTGSAAAPASYGNPAAVSYAWAGMAWDSTRHNLMLFGGGHANYGGNEVYLWQGSNGEWTRGSLPSRLDSNRWVVGNGAPQSSHTYQTSTYVPGNDRFVVFGGAAYNSGGAITSASGQTGPWWWDPSRASANQVGGATGTGIDPATTGAQSWQARTEGYPWAGLPSTAGLQFVNGVSAYRNEGGRDVIYLSTDVNSSGFPALYRYQLGTPDSPDQWSMVGVNSTYSGQGGAATIDTRRNLFVRTAMPSGTMDFDLSVWLLDKNNPSAPGANRSIGIQLVDTHGNPLNLARVSDWKSWASSNELAASIDYDSLNDRYVIWDGADRGTVWSIKPLFNDDGSINTTWIAERLLSTTHEQPMGFHGDGVLGKWKYIDELDAFLAMDIFSPFVTGDPWKGGDAGIWLYRPLGDAAPPPPPPAGVPEAPTLALLGLTLVGLAVQQQHRLRRRRT